jgi:hypothetical protein
MWRRAFRVGGVDVAIDCALPACSAMLEPLCRLYEDGTAPPTLHFWIRPDDGQIRLGLHEETLWQGTDAGEIVAGFEVHLYRQLLAAMAPGILSLHAGSVAVATRACLLPADSGSGKSSLVTAAMLDGADYLSDEFALLSHDGRVLPFPRPLQWGKLRHPAFRHAEMLAEGRHAKAMFRFPDRHGNIIRNLLWLPTHVRHTPAEVSIVALPHYRRHAPDAEILPIRRGEALMELPRHLHHRMAPTAMLQELNARLPATARFYRLSFSDARAAWRGLKALLAAEA